MVPLLRDTVYRKIRQAILTCELQPNQELREQALAEIYHVSRSPVRDSLLRLERENLVTVLPRQGYRVNQIVQVDVENMYGLRLIIEPACAAAAAKAADDALQSLDRFRGFTGERIDDPGFLDYNKAFHGAVADLAGNKRVAAIEYALIEEQDRMIWAGLHPAQSGLVNNLLQEHDAIINAIQAHDETMAYHLAQQHVARGRTRIAAVFGLRD
jgi:DNA-binding GntR family transcriptional regulator